MIAANNYQILVVVSLALLAELAEFIKLVCILKLDSGRVALRLRLRLRLLLTFTLALALRLLSDLLLAQSFFGLSGSLSLSSRFDLPFRLSLLFRLGLACLLSLCRLFLLIL